MRKYRGEVAEFLGVRYYRYPKSPWSSTRRYFQRQGKWLHRVVWEYYNGPIPPGHDIHHKDKNTTNNAIENLECVSRAEHLGNYHRDITPERIELFKRFVRPKAAGWHHSPEGRAWHSEHAREQWKEWKARAPFERECQVCGKLYTLACERQGLRFCSARCRTRARYFSGVDNVERTCPICQATFTVNRYAQKRCCSRSCGQRLRASRK